MKSFIVSLLTFTLATTSITPTAFSEPDFTDRMRHAFMQTLGSGGQDTEAFDEMIQLNPDEWLIYLGYYDALNQAGNLVKAKDILERAYAIDHPDFHQYDLFYENAFAKIERKQKIKEAKRNAPRNAKFESYGNQSFVIKTNIPRKDVQNLIDEIQEIYDAELELLHSILGEADHLLPYVGIEVFWDKKEYEKHFRKIHRNLPVEPVFYQQDAKTFSIFYDGEADLLKVAHLMVYFFIDHYYREDYSMWFKAGLSQYIGAKVSKANAYRAVMHMITYMNWLYDQGQWNHFEQVFDYSFKTKQLITINPNHQGIGQFFLLASSFMHFLVETDNEMTKSFFEQYLERFEKSDGEKTSQGAENYFKEKLTDEEYEKMNDLWLKHCLALNFEDI